MVRRLTDELKQTRPFATLEEEVIVGLARTADAMQRSMAPVLKARALSPAQYNVLRILRGAGTAGLPCGEISARMVTRDPDVTRLFDRLEKRGLVARSRDDRDRRVVTTRITESGRALLVELEEPLHATHRRLLGHLGPARLKALADLLDLARSASE